MAQMTDNQIKHMVERFLMWKLPEAFNPDAGISFKPMFNEHTDHPMRHEPSGTNLLDYTQATEMVRHMLQGLPDASVKEAGGEWRDPVSGTTGKIDATSDRSGTSLSRINDRWFQTSELVPA